MGAADRVAWRESLRWAYMATRGRKDRWVFTSFDRRASWISVTNRLVRRGRQRSRVRPPVFAMTLALATAKNARLDRSEIAPR